MAPRMTRSKANGSAPKLQSQSSSISTTAQKNGPQLASQNPPKLFILPKDTSPDARIITLSHPRTGTPSSCFFCPVKGFYEIKNIAPPSKSQPRSWLLTPSEFTQPTKNGGTADSEENKDKYDAAKGYITSDASLFIATPLDPLFVLLQALEGSCTDEKQRFLSLDDHMDELIAKSPAIRHLLQHKSVTKWFDGRMAAVCDQVDAGDEQMYRLNQDKLLAVLAEKCRAVVEKGLPDSLEDAMIRKPLEKPLASIERGDSSLDDRFAEDEEAAASVVKLDELSIGANKVTTESFSAVVSEPPKQIVEIRRDPIDAPESIVDALRMQTAFMLIITSYIGPKLGKLLTDRLNEGKAAPFPDMKELAAHLKQIKELKEKAAAARSLGDFSNKREFDEERESRAEKKRKLEEEEKAKKKNMTRGVRDLQKVNVSGMKKMSDFFKKK